MEEAGFRRRRRRGRRRSERRRAVYLLPNLVTSAALLLGYGSIVASIHQDFEQAALFIVLAGIADMLDGRIARATNSTSAFGVASVSGRSRSPRPAARIIAFMSALRAAARAAPARGTFCKPRRRSR